MITYRIEKGSPLTVAELDENFRTLENKMEEIAEKIQPICLKVEQDKDVLLLKNAETIIGRIILPKFQPNIRGQWKTNTFYTLGDWCYLDKKLYVCTIDHESTDVFEEKSWQLGYAGGDA